MNKIYVSAIAVLSLLICSCSGGLAPESENKVLLLQVDYLTNSFEAGKELSFEHSTTTFSVQTEYTEPGDFGSIRLIYEELNEPIFFGTIHWMGLGERLYPETLLPKDNFDHVLTADYVSPVNGFEDVFNPAGTTYDYNVPWTAIQGLVLVRTYLESNPGSKVRVFLYTPSVGIGDPADWDWIFIIKN